MLFRTFSAHLDFLIPLSRLRDEKAPASHISRTLKPSAIAIHPIINVRDQSTSDALLASRLNVNVMFNSLLN
jgi:hypothetical protein